MNQEWTIQRNVTFGAQETERRQQNKTKKNTIHKKDEQEEPEVNSGAHEG